MGKQQEALAAAELVAARESAAKRLAGGHFAYTGTLMLTQITRWGDIIEAVEAEGWELVHFSALAEGHAVTVYRRIRPSFVVMGAAE